MTAIELHDLREVRGGETVLGFAARTLGRHYVQSAQTVGRTMGRQYVDFGRAIVNAYR